MLVGFDSFVEIWQPKKFCTKLHSISKNGTQASQEHWRNQVHFHQLFSDTVNTENSGKIGLDPNVSKFNRLHADFFQIFLINLKFVP